MFIDVTPYSVQQYHWSTVHCIIVSHFSISLGKSSHDLFISIVSFCNCTIPYLIMGWSPSTDGQGRRERFWLYFLHCWAQSEEIQSFRGNQSVPNCRLTTLQGILLESAPCDPMIRLIQEILFFFSSPELHLLTKIWLYVLPFEQHLVHWQKLYPQSEIYTCT